MDPVPDLGGPKAYSSDVRIQNTVSFYGFRRRRISINLLHIQDTDWRQICRRPLRVHNAMDPAYQ